MVKTFNFLFPSGLMALVFLAISMPVLPESLPPPGNDMRNDGFFPPMPGASFNAFLPMGRPGFLDELKKKLALTKEQGEKLKNLFESKIQEDKILNDQLSLDLAALRLLFDEKGLDSSLKEALGKISDDQAAIQESEKAFREKINAVLTPKQQAQLIVEIPMGGPPGVGFFGRKGLGGLDKDSPQRSPNLDGVKTR